MRSSWGTVSKAFFRSINKAPVNFPASVLLLIESQKYVTAVRVEWCRLNPDWNAFNTPCWCKYCWSWTLTAVSAIYLQSRQICVFFLVFYLSIFLKLNYCFKVPRFSVISQRSYHLLVYTTQVNNTFRARWLASSEVISQVLFTSEQPKKNKVAFVAIF